MTTISELLSQLRAQLGRPEEDATAMEDHRLYSSEVFWREHYFWLKGKGYLLRPRLHPEWVASWKGTDKNWDFAEDGQVGNSPSFRQDATRIADGAQVMLKKFDPALQPNEADIGRFFSSEPHSSHAGNHCVPIYDVLVPNNDENLVIIAMPHLSDWSTPAFETIGETVEFFRQLFLGLEFMHSLNVAHNDVKFDNVMMDAEPLFDEARHPVKPSMKLDFSGRAKKPHSRTLRPVRYYYIDFGHARRYDPKDGPPREFVGIGDGYGGDGTVPEFQTTNEFCDPFPVDVYRVGNLIREFFTEGNEYGNRKQRGLDFMKPLLQDMCQDDPTKRPTMSEVVMRFSKITSGLSAWKLRSRVVDITEPYLITIIGCPGHWARQFVRIIKRVPSIPTP